MNVEILYRLVTSISMINDSELSLRGRPSCYAGLIIPLSVDGVHGSMGPIVKIVCLHFNLSSREIPS